MDDCLQRLLATIDSHDGLHALTPSDCISKLVTIRLQMQAPYVSTWPQALSIQVIPSQLPSASSVELTRAFLLRRHSQWTCPPVLSRGLCLLMRSGMQPVILPLTLIGISSALSLLQYIPPPSFIGSLINLQVYFLPLPLYNHSSAYFCERLPCWFLN